MEMIIEKYKKLGYRGTLVVGDKTIHVAGFTPEEVMEKSVALIQLDNLHFRLINETC